MMDHDGGRKLMRLLLHWAHSNENYNLVGALQVYGVRGRLPRLSALVRLGVLQAHRSAQTTRACTTNQQNCYS
jgi:hypothetical protein